MKRREFLKMLGSSLVLAASGSIRSLAAAPSKKPNIILCMADDQGWGDMSYYGHKVLKTPSFDAMAAASLRLDRFYAAAPVCSPTRGSVMTGRHPNRFGCLRAGHCLRPQEITVAKLLKTAGYTTGHFGKWHLGSVLKGSPVNPGASGFDEWFSSINFFDNNPIMSRQGVAEQTKGEGSMVAVDAALDFIRRHAESDKPFFSVVWFGAPHGPHSPAADEAEPYKDQPPEKRDFFGEIAGMDRAFGKLRAELRRLEIENNTILWYCSDNGGLKGLSNTGGRENKGSIYEGGLRVPAMLEWPDQIASPGKTSVPCCTSDILPTLLEIAGAAMPDNRPLDGISLVPLFQGAMTRRPAPIGFWQYPAKNVSMPSIKWMADLLKAQKQGKEIDSEARLFRNAGRIGKAYPEDSFPGHAAWLDWPWKLHRIQETGKTDTTLELYNLALDPDEAQDLAAREPERVAAMRAAIETWLASVARSLNGKDYR